MTDSPDVTPSPPPSRRWINSPAWTLLEQAHDGHMLLVLTGGADETYIVDEATTDACVHRVFEAWQRDGMSSLLDDPECGAAVRQIQRVGALVPPRAIARASRLSVIWLGTESTALMPALTAMLAEHGVELSLCDEANEADMLLIVRTNAAWQAALRDYAAMRPQRPHLFVDLAYHHTLGIGPYVVPGETACVACMGHRVAHRWGNLSNPSTPIASGRPQSVAALLAPLLAVPEGLLPFLERGVSVNLQTLASTRDKVYQLPWCPACGSRREAPSGSLPLPWQSDASQAQSETEPCQAGY